MAAEVDDSLRRVSAYESGAAETRRHDLAAVGRRTSDVPSGFLPAGNVDEVTADAASIRTQAG